MGKRRLVIEAAAVIALAIASALCVAAPFAWRGVLYHDTLHAFSYFADNLDSLNRFGEPAWWSPNITAGMPGYFYGMLGQPNLARPAFVAIGAIAWALGQVGVRLPSALPLYAFQFGFLIPAIFLLGTWLVARQVFRTRTAVFYVLAVAAVSPGILVNLSDPGVLENSGYALLCTAALLRFVGRPTRRSFAILVAAALLLSVGASQMVLATAAPLLVALAVTLVACTRSTRRALRAIPPAHALVALALLAATALPSALAYQQQHGEIVHADLGRSLDYSYGELKSGNPLQFLVASVPGVGFDWDVYKQPAAGPPAEYGIRTLQWGQEIGNNYLGLLATPLAAIGLVAGRRRVRVPLFVMVMISATVFVMYGASPAFAPFLVALSPLRTLNHFGDLLYGGGAFLLVLFAAGLGLETLERRRDWLRRTARWFPLWSVVALAGYRAWAEPPSVLLACAIAASAGFAVLFWLAARAVRPARARALLAGVVVLSLVDVSTLAFLFLRGIHGGAGPVDESRFGRSIGDDGVVTTRLARVFMLRETKHLAESELPVESLPFRAGFCAAAAEDGPITPEQLAAGFGGPAPGRRVVLRPDADAAPVLAAFAAEPARCEIEFGRGNGRYNAVRLPVRAAQPALVFFRDGYAPEWQATVNGAPVPILRAFGAFKAVAVPAGESVVDLRYAPPGVGISLAVAYAIVLLAAVVAWRMRE